MYGKKLRSQWKAMCCWAHLDGAWIVVFVFQTSLNRVIQTYKSAFQYHIALHSTLTSRLTIPTKTKRHAEKSSFNIFFVNAQFIYSRFDDFQTKSGSQRCFCRIRRINVSVIQIPKALRLTLTLNDVPFSILLLP